MALDDILLEAEEKMEKTEQVVQHEFGGVRTGKASPALVENIMVEVYGSMMRLRELAGITTPESRMLVIQPWDNASLGPIEKAIQKANLGLNPAVQGRMIRLILPELSTERRQEMVKIARKMSEDGRVAIRHVRRDAMEQIKKESKASGNSEEDVDRCLHREDRRAPRGEGKGNPDRVSKGYFAGFSSHRSPKKPASTTRPGQRELGGVFTSTTAQSGSFGTWRALFR
jgi:ribosome recycling factor